MIDLVPSLSISVTTLKRLMRERSLDPDEKVAMVALLSALDDGDGIVTIAEADLADRLSMSPRALRRALGALWALDYIDELGRIDDDGLLRITLRREVPE